MKDFYNEDFITVICAQLAKIDQFNRRTDACVRLHSNLDGSRHFDFIEGSDFSGLSSSERDRLENARSLITDIIRRGHQHLYGISQQLELADHYLMSSGTSAYRPLASRQKTAISERYPTIADSNSFWNFLPGGSTGLVQQK